MEMQSVSDQKNNNNSNYHSIDDSDTNQSWLIISIISWILFIIAIWHSYMKTSTLWDTIEYQVIYYYSTTSGSAYYPLEMQKEYIFVFIFLMSVVGFGVYLVFTTYKKKQSLIEGMLGPWSKFHFIPLLFIAALYIIAENALYDSSLDGFKYNKKILIFDLIFTIIALALLIIVYIMTDLNCEWYIVMATKKGVFSTFIVILWYNFFHIIVTLRAVNYIIDNGHDGTITDLFNFYKRIGISFVIIMGVLTLVFSFFFKDIMIAFVNFLIYLGMVIEFFSKTEKQREFRKDLFYGYADGILQIIIMCLSLVMIACLILLYKQRVF